jgi:hypothetical protein
MGNTLHKGSSYRTLPSVCHLSECWQTAVNARHQAHCEDMCGQCTTCTKIAAGNGSGQQAACCDTDNMLKHAIWHSPVRRCCAQCVVQVWLLRAVALEEQAAQLLRAGDAAAALALADAARAPWAVVAGAEAAFLLIHGAERLPLALLTPRGINMCS